MENHLNMPVHVEDEKLLPKYDHDTDAGLNLYAAQEVTIPPGEHRKIPTGIRAEIPKGCAAIFWDRSGMAHKDDLTIIGGVIDEGYRGEWGVLLFNLGKNEQKIEKYQKIAQALIQRVEHVTIQRTDTLNTETDRGEGGFGSTGAF